METSDFKQLKVWQGAVELASHIYKLTATFPKEEKYGLISQLCRAAVSVSANIAEGQGRNSNKEFIHFLSMSRGSLCEVESHLYVAISIGFIQEKDISHILPLIKSIGKMTVSLSRVLEKKVEVVAISAKT